MRLLIFTQAIDRKDSVLGSYHGWTTEIAKHFEHVTVFALRVGDYDLPKNVMVIPLRPWTYRAPVRTALRVILLTWKHRKEYDAVLVHMNQEYLLVAGWLFRLLGKRVYMWRNHYAGNMLTDVAAFFCDKVFYTSKSSYTAKYKNAVQMPVGVDVGSCHLDEPIERKPRSVLFLSRFDESKRPDLLVEALGILAQKKIVFTAMFVGGSKDPDSSFPKKVADRAEALGLGGRVAFVGPAQNTETYRYYRSHAIYVDAAQSGMFNKTLFKAIACGCLPLFVSSDMAELIGSEFLCRDGDVNDLAEHLEKALALSEDARSARVATYGKQAIDAHILPVLGLRLAKEIQIVV